MKNLVVVAHPDDEILGFGGAGAACVDAGEVVQPLILCGDVGARSKRPTDKQLFEDMTRANAVIGFQQPILGSFPNIQMNTIPHLEVVQFIEAIIEKYQPDRIFTHHPADLNNDHLQVSRACMAAARLFQRRIGIKPLTAFYFMEVLSATDWSFDEAGNSFKPNSFFDISSSLEKKISALSCYQNVMRKVPHPRSVEVIRGHAAYRGGQSGFVAAEAFQQVFRSGF
jgi:LmbE family N-acetylglucosaminyl deacetylase